MRRRRTRSVAPVKLFGHQADFQGGVHCAMVTLAAFFYRLNSGRGQVIDLSQQECLAPMIELNWPFYSYAGKEITRLGGRFNPQPADVFECADGKVLMTVYGDHIWRRFVEFMGNPDWARNEAYNDAFGRVHHGEAIKERSPVDGAMEGERPMPRAAGIAGANRAGQHRRGGL